MSVSQLNGPSDEFNSMDLVSDQWNIAFVLEAFDAGHCILRYNLRISEIFWRLVVHGCWRKQLALRFPWSLNSDNNDSKRSINLVLRRHFFLRDIKIEIVRESLHFIHHTKRSHSLTLLPPRLQKINNMNRAGKINLYHQQTKWTKRTSNSRNNKHLLTEFYYKS